MKPSLHKEIKEALAKSAQTLLNQAGKELQSENEIAVACRSFLWEYANKLTDKEGEKLYIQSLCEFVLVKALLSPTETEIKESALLEKYFEIPYNTLIQRASSKKIVDDIKVCFSTIYQQVNFVDYQSLCLEYSLAPHWYPSKFFKCVLFSEDLKKLIQTVLSKHLSNEKELKVIDPFSNHKHLLCSILNTTKPAIYFKSFPHYLTESPPETENFYWLDTLREHSFILPPQMDIFSVNPLQEDLIYQGTRVINLIVSDLRNLPAFFTKSNATKVSKRIKETYMKHSFNIASASDGILKIFRWCTDRIQPKGSILFMVDKSIITNETYSGLRRSLQEEFNLIQIIEVEENNASFYLLLLKEKI